MASSLVHAAFAGPLVPPIGHPPCFFFARFPIALTTRNSIWLVALRSTAKLALWWLVLVQQETL